MTHSPRRRSRAALAVTAAVVGFALATPACSDDEPEVGSFCDELRQVPSLAAVITGFPDQDPTQLARKLDETQAEYTDLRESAPDEIEPDVARTVDLVDAVIGAIRTNSDDPVAAAEAVRGVVDDHPEAATSGLAVADYARQECQVELNPTVDDLPDGTGTDDPGEVDPASVAEDEDGVVEGGM